MKSLMSSLALVVSLGLCSAALADNGCSSCGQSDGCCGHGLLSRLRLHRGNDCCETSQSCGTSCDSCGGHGLRGWFGRHRLGHGDCGSCGGCEASCGSCAPKCCRTRIAMPRCHARRCETSCNSCDSGCGGGHFSRLRGLMHRDSCSSCGSCNSCGGHGLGLHGLFGRRCNGCETSCNGCSGGGNGWPGGTDMPSSAPSTAPAPAPIPAPAPAPKPSASSKSSNGLLILTPAG
jgi:hypothetical protein